MTYSYVPGLILVSDSIAKGSKLAEAQTDAKHAGRASKKAIIGCVYLDAYILAAGWLWLQEDPGNWASLASG